MHPVLTSEIDGVTHRDVPRNEARMTVEVETDLVGIFGVCSQVIDAGYPKRGEKRIPHKQTIAIYESQWPEVQKLVRTDAHNAALAAAMAQAPNDPALAEKRRAAELNLARAKGPSQRERAEAAIADLEGEVFSRALAILSTMPGCRGGLPPLLSARVVRRGAPPPETDRTMLQNSHADLAAVLTRLLDERSGRKSKE